MIPAAPVVACSSMPEARRLRRELRIVRRRLDDVVAAAVERYGAAALQVIDLPPVMGPTGELVPAQIRAAGALLWASEVEQAGIPAFVDALVRGTLEGKVLLPITSGADRLMVYWRSRNERFSPEERQALYQRIFGSPGDMQHPFAGPFARLLEALDFLAHAGPQVNPTEAAIRANTAARDVALWLSQSSGGITPFAARSIAEQVHAALAILREPDVARSLGGGSPWRMIRMHAQEFLGHPVDPEPHLDRASAALDLTHWLADAATAIDSGSAAVPPPEVLQAAEVWITSGMSGR